MGELLTVEELRTRLRVSRAWVYKAVAENRIPHVRLGGPDGPVRFMVEDIDAWVREAREAWPASPAQATKT